MLFSPLSRITIHFEMMGLFGFFYLFFCFLLLFLDVVVTLAYHLSLKLQAGLEGGCFQSICNAFVTNMRKPRNGKEGMWKEAQMVAWRCLRSVEGTEEG